MSQAERIVVVGAGLAGLRSAERLRELGFDGELVIIGAESLPPYHRPALSKQLISGAMRPNDLMLPAYQEIGAKWRLGTTASWLSPRNRMLRLPGGEELRYDGLIIATGVEPVRPNDVPYHDQRIMVMRTLPDALNLERAIAANRGPVAVIGGGFTGCELAASLRHMGREVTLIGRSPSLLGNVLGPKLGDWLTGLHRDHGVDLALGTSVVDWQPSSDGVGLYLSDSTSLLAACVVIAAGTLPATGWLRGSGLPLDNGVVCESTCHVVGAEDVVAAGDVAQWPNIRFDSIPRRIEHWLNAVEMGRAAAESLLAGRARALPFTPMPRFWTEQYGVRIQAAGVPKLGTDTITLGTPDDGTGTVVGYVRDGKLMGVVGVDCPSSVLTWTDTIRQQNPSPTDPVLDPADEGPTPSRTGARHSLPPKPKRSRAKSPTHTRLTPTDPTPSNPRLTPAAESSARFAPATAAARQSSAEASARFAPAATGSRLHPASRNGFPPAIPDARPGPADSYGRLTPASPTSSNPRLRPAVPPAGNPPTNGHLRSAGNPPTNGRLARVGNPPANGHLRPAGNPPTNGQLRSAGNPPTNGRLAPVGNPPTNGHLRPAGNPPTNGHLRPAGNPPTNGHLRPAGNPPTNGQLRSAMPPNGHRDPAISNGRPTNGFGPNDSNPRLRPAMPPDGNPPTNGHLRSAIPPNGHRDPAISDGRPTNGFGPQDSNGRLRPAIPPNGHRDSAMSNGRPTNGFGPSDSNPRLRPAMPPNGNPPTNGHLRPAIPPNGHRDPAMPDGRPTNGFGPSDSNPRLRPAIPPNGRPANGHAATNGHHTPTNGHNGTNGHSRPTNGHAATNGHSPNNGHGPTNGHHSPNDGHGPANGHHANGHSGPTDSNGRLRPLDIYGRFEALDATGEIEPVTGWIPRVDARRSVGR